jgi:malic enzyme
MFDLATLALPGLLSALCGHDCSVLTVDALAAAARAIALITPADRTLPDPQHRLLVSAVARHVSRTLAARAAQHPRP